MKNVLLLTPIYPADDIPKAYTPVVHYFAREWVKMGYRVVVINYISNFPKWITLLSLPFNNILSSVSGATVRTNIVHEKTYNLEGVTVKRIPLLKYIPHSRFSKAEINKAYRKTIKFCDSISFIPDCIIGHWYNPQIEFLSMLKEYYKVPSVLVMHNGVGSLKSVYKQDSEILINNIDILGFRSDAIKRNFENSIKVNKPTFYCYSGIPEQFLENKNYVRKFDNIKSFVFVGTLIKRKFPSEIIYSLENSFKSGQYKLNYVGVGSEAGKIRDIVRKLHREESVKLHGRVDRKDVQKILHENDVFIMISKNEAFGLVYLEAMAAGCITIASRNEGFDGIIKDGINGFLCEAGNVKELSTIITKIRNMDSALLSSISNNAIETARNLSDKNAAKMYISDIENISGC